MNWQPGDLSPDARRAAEAAADAAGLPLKDWFAETVRAAILRDLGQIPSEEPEVEPPAENSAERDSPPPSATDPMISLSTMRRDEPLPREPTVEAPAAVAPPVFVPILEPEPMAPEPEPIAASEPAPCAIAEPDPIVLSPVAEVEPAAPEPLVEPDPPLAAPVEAAPHVAPTPPTSAEPPAPRSAPERAASPPPALFPVEPRRLTDPGFSTWLATRIQGLPARATPVAPSTPGAASPTPAISPATTRPRLEPIPPAPVQPIPAAPAPLPQPTVAAKQPTTAAAPSEMPLPLSLPSGPVTSLRLTSLRPARIRSRRTTEMDPGIASLAGSVAAHGVREPILVRRLAEKADQYEVVAGERRRLAAERASRPDVPAVIVDAQDAETLLLSLTENLGRGDFSPLDEARAYLRLLTEYRVSPGALAQRLARERSHIALVLRLLGLPPKVRQLIDSGRIASGQAFTLLSASDPEAMAEQMVLAAPGGPARDSGEHL